MTLLRYIHDKNVVNDKILSRNANFKNEHNKANIMTLYVGARKGFGHFFSRDSPLAEKMARRRGLTVGKMACRRPNPFFCKKSFS